MPPRSPDSFVLYRAVLLAAALVAFGFIFNQLLTLMLAGIATFVISVPLEASASYLERYRVPRALGALVGLIVAAGLLTGAGWIIIPSVMHESHSFSARLPHAVDQVRNDIHHISGISDNKIASSVNHWINNYRHNPDHIISEAANFGFTLVGFMAALIFMVMMAYYTAVRPQPLVQGFLRVFHPNRREHVAQALSRIRRAWIGWMQGVSIHMVISFTVVYIGLRLIHIDFALIFAVIAALFTLIPYFGVLISGGLAVIYGLSYSPEKALLVLLVFLFTQQLEGNVIIPLVMANRVKHHPVVIGTGVVVIGRLFGILGLFIAVPLLSLVLITFEEFWVRPMEGKEKPLLAPETAMGNTSPGVLADETHERASDPDA
jgi:predicted PurR-regulated permease PerM